MTPLISIIVPVYNTEKYLKKCIESCLSQNINKNLYEIIIINDGSTDYSEQIIIEFAKKHYNIIFKSQNNQGVSASRNLGISLAKGKYIIFVDSDDTIKQNSLGEVLEIINSNDLDLIIVGSVQKDKNTIEFYPYPSHLTNEIVSGEKLFLSSYLRGSACGVVFRKAFLEDKDLLFPTNIEIGEDSIFMTFCFIFAQKIKGLNLQFYEVCFRDNSASRTWSIEKVKAMLVSLRTLKLFIQNIELNDLQKAMIHIRAYGIISNSLYYFFQLSKFEEYFEIRSLIKESEFYPIKTYGVSHFRLKILLLNFSIEIFCLPFIFRQQYIIMKRLFN